MSDTYLAGESEPVDGGAMDEMVPWRQSLVDGLGYLLLSWFLEFLCMKYNYQWGGPELLWESLALIPSFLGVYAFWLITTLAPGGKLQRVDGLRLLIRWMAAGFCVWEIVGVVGYFSGWLEYEAGVTVGLVLVSVHVVAFSIYMCAIAMLIDRQRFVWQTRLAMWGLALGLLGFSACLPIVEAMEQQEAGVELWQVIFFTATALLVVVFGIWSMVLIWRYRNALAKA